MIDFCDLFFFPFQQELSLYDSQLTGRDGGEPYSWNETKDDGTGNEAQLHKLFQSPPSQTHFVDVDVISLPSEYTTDEHTRDHAKREIRQFFSTT